MTGSPLAAGKGSSVLWRNNGDSTFTEWTEPTGLAGSGNTAGATSPTSITIAPSISLSPATATRRLIYENPREGTYSACPALRRSRICPPTRHRMSRLQQRWLDGRRRHPCRRSRNQSVAQRGGLTHPALRARPAARFRRLRGMGTHRDRYRQRWLDRSRRNRRNGERARAARLAQSRRSGL